MNKEDIEEIRFVLSFKGHQQEKDIDNFPVWRAKKRFNQYITSIEQLTKMFSEKLGGVSKSIPHMNTSH
jgi:hypothetical protein